MSDTKVGILISETTQRDAIHVAVAPVIVDDGYPPGTHVGLLPDGRVGILAEPKIGIIDPFLKDCLRAGDRCYLFLYPGTITGLRHSWTHPAFSTPQELSDAEKGESETWLRKYAFTMNIYDETEEQRFARLIAGLKDGALYAYGNDLHGLYDLEDADLLKFHAERFLGIRVDWANYTFSCSC